MTLNEQMYTEMLKDISEEISENNKIDWYGEYEEIIPTTVCELQEFESVMFKQDYSSGNILKFLPLLQVIENMSDQYKEFINSDEYIDLIDYYKEEFLALVEDIVLYNLSLIK